MVAFFDNEKINNKEQSAVELAAQQLAEFFVALIEERDEVAPKNSHPTKL